MPTASPPESYAIFRMSGANKIESPMPAALQFIALLIVAFGMTYWLCDLLEQAERLPLWLTPRLAALAVTFFVALFWILKNARPIVEDPGAGFIE